MENIKPIIEKFYKTGKWEGDFESKIKGFIKNFVSSKGLDETIRRIVGDDYVEEVYSVFTIKLFENKELILSKENVSFGYLTAMIKNAIMDIYRKRAMNYEISIQSLQNPDKEGNLEDVIITQEPPKYYPIEVEELFNKILKLLDEKDKETLCYYISKQLGEEFEVKTLSKDALYKRWERLKKKLRENLEEVNTELWKAFIDLYMSEVCDKLR